MSIRPGIAIEITLERTLMKGHLRALIYDVDKNRIIISQTSPPLLASQINRYVNISYIFKKGKRSRRMGFSAMISGFIKNYELSSGTYVPALIMDIKSEPEEMSLRRSFRVQTRHDSGISLMIRGKTYSIADISLTGLSFTQSLFQGSFRPADVLDIELIIDEKNYTVKGSVIRVAETIKSRVISVVFKDMDNDLDSVLGKKIIMIEREILSGLLA